MTVAPSINVSTSEAVVELAGLGIHYVSGGRGVPVVVLHHSTGPMWSAFQEELAASVRVLNVDLPGYGQSDRPSWARSPRDVAVLVGRLLDTLGLDGAHVVGLGFGGWVAAELATMSDERLASMTVVGAAGLKPEVGEIHDPVMGSFEDYVARGFHDQGCYERLFGDPPPEDLVTLWDHSREMTCRLTWRPWMFSRQLPHLLPLVRVPSLVVWGEHDAIVPRDCGEQYASALPDSRLEIMPECGHAMDLEKATELAELVLSFVEQTSGSGGVALARPGRAT